MIKKKRLVVGNWKMNIQTVAEAKKIVQAAKRKTAKIRKTDIVFCPPFIYLQALAPLMKGKYKLGVQNIFSEDSGSYTGEISAKQLKQFGVAYAVLGHSERRKLGETDEMVAAKVQVALRNDLTPVLCIGEWKRDEDGEYLQFIKMQLVHSLAGVSRSQISDIVIAYEPVSYIGAAEAMQAHQIHEMILYIRKCLNYMFSDYASSVQIIYGGSANAENAAGIIETGAAEGLLPGRDSLDGEKFSGIIKAVDSVK